MIETPKPDESVREFSIEYYIFAFGRSTHIQTMNEHIGYFLVSSPIAYSQSKILLINNCAPCGRFYAYYESAKYTGFDNNRGLAVGGEIGAGVGLACTAVVSERS